MQHIPSSLIECEEITLPQQFFEEIQDNNAQAADRNLDAINLHVDSTEEDFDIDWESTQTFSVGQLSEICPHGFCRAKHFKHEWIKTGSRHFKSCCHDGQINLPSDRQLKNPPSLLINYLTNNTPEARNFRENIRSYNAALAFASLGAEIHEAPGQGPYSFQIHGQVYHQISQLEPTENISSRYGQLYIIDAEQALEERLQIFANRQCRVDVMRNLQHLIQASNPIAQRYLTIRDALQNQRPPEDLKMIFIDGANNDFRRANAPANKSEIAVVFVDENEGKKAFKLRTKYLLIIIIFFF